MEFNKEAFNNLYEQYSLLEAVEIPFDETFDFGDEVGSKILLIVVTSHF